MFLTHNKLPVNLPGLILKIMSIVLMVFLTSCNQSDYSLLNGSTATIPNPKGWVLINYWAAWCKPCLEEIPEINRLAVELPTPLVAVYGIYFDATSTTELQSSVRQFKVEFVNFSPNQTELPVPRPTMLPANYLISPENKVFGPLLGPQTKSSILLAIQQYQSQKD
jgi:thiol-disulfide isomerase/thioredoxin